MKDGWTKKQVTKKEYERWRSAEEGTGEKGDTDFTSQFLKIVREKYGEDFDFEECTIERGTGGDCNVVTFQRTL